MVWSKGVRYRRPESARSPRPSTKPVEIIHRIYLFHVFGFSGDADILRIKHLFRDARIIRRCHHSGRRIREIRTFIIRNADIIVLVIDDGWITRCVILNECVIDFEYVATGETCAVTCAISWCSHARMYVCAYVCNDTYSLQNKIESELNLSS